MANLGTVFVTVKADTTDFSKGIATAAEDGGKTLATGVEGQAATLGAKGETAGLAVGAGVNRGIAKSAEEVEKSTAKLGGGVKNVIGQASGLGVVGAGESLIGLAGAAVAVAGAVAVGGAALDTFSNKIHHSQVVAEQTSAALKVVSGYTKDVTDFADTASVDKAIASVSHLQDLLSRGQEKGAANAVGKQLDEIIARSKTATTQEHELATTFGISDDAVHTYAQTLGVDLSGSYGTAHKALQDYIATEVAGTPATRAVNRLLLDQAGGARTAGRVIDDLSAAVDALAGSNSNLLGDQLAASDAIRNLGKNVDATSRSLDRNTDAGEANNLAIKRAADAAVRYSQGQLKATGDVKAFNANMYLQAAALETQAVKLGFSKSEADALIQSLFAVPKTITTTYQTPGLDEAQRKLADIRFNADQLNGKIISMAVVVNGQGVPQGGDAYSGYARPHARGGVAEGWSWVGEEGPELIHVGSPSRVLPADESRAVAMGGGSGSDMREVTKLLRTLIGVAGGQGVQVAAALNGRARTSSLDRRTR